MSFERFLGAAIEDRAVSFAYCPSDDFRMVLVRFAFVSGAVIGWPPIVWPIGKMLASEGGRRKLRWGAYLPTSVLWLLSALCTLCSWVLPVCFEQHYLEPIALNIGHIAAQDGLNCLVNTSPCGFVMLVLPVQGLVDACCGFGVWSSWRSRGLLAVWFLALPFTLALAFLEALTLAAIVFGCGAVLAFAAAVAIGILRSGLDRT